MQIYEHIQHPCTTLHLTGRAQDTVLQQLIAEARGAIAGGTDGATGAVGA